MAKKTKTKAGWILMLGHMASFLCLIHCLATVALTFVAPSVLKMMPHNYWVESGAWTFVLVSTLFLLSRAPMRKWHYGALGIFFVWGTYALIIHNHNLFTGAFMSLACFQLYLTLSHHFMEHTADDECCQHPHHHHIHHQPVPEEGKP